MMCPTVLVLCDLRTRGRFARRVGSHWTGIVALDFGVASRPVVSSRRYLAAIESVLGKLLTACDSCLSSLDRPKKPDAGRSYTALKSERRRIDKVRGSAGRARFARPAARLYAALCRCAPGLGGAFPGALRASRDRQSTAVAAGGLAATRRTFTRVSESG